MGGQLQDYFVLKTPDGRYVHSDTAVRVGERQLKCAVKLTDNIFRAKIYHGLAATQMVIDGTNDQYNKFHMIFPDIPEKLIVKAIKIVEEDI